MNNYLIVDRSFLENAASTGGSNASHLIVQRKTPLRYVKVCVSMLWSLNGQFCFFRGVNSKYKAKTVQVCAHVPTNMQVIRYEKHLFTSHLHRNGSSYVYWVLYDSVNSFITKALVYKTRSKLKTNLYALLCIP